MNAADQRGTDIRSVLISGIRERGTDFRATRGPRTWLSRRKHDLMALFLLLSVLFAATPSSLFAAAGEPCLYDTPAECGLLNTLWRAGTAAGNGTDWYRNRDGDHAAINRSLFPQINDYNPLPPTGFEREIVDAPRIIVGNASQGVSGLYGLVRYYGMGDFTGSANGNVDKLQLQYRASQTYWYPAVRDVYVSDPNARDLSIGMFPYAHQSVGASGSELDEVTKYFHTLAAFKPAVKTKLTDEGLLIPAVQMIYRRTRVANDAEYLTGLAHPSAFDNYANDVAMINMAQAMETNNIPPMIDLVVEKEDYGDFHFTRYNDAYKSEKLFTSPAAIARIFRGPEYTKRMVVDAGGSTDANGLPLTYRFVVLRGDPDHVRITPLNAEASRVEIEIDYHPEAVDPYSGRPSSLVIVGAFVHNGHYYSAPGFISSLSLFNETRTYDGNHLLKEIVYTDNGDIEAYDLSRDHDWDRDTYAHDFNGRMAGWTRQAAGDLTSYTAEGLLQTSTDTDGRPLEATEVSYSWPSTPPYITVTPDTNWYAQVEYVYTSLTTPADTPVDHAPGVAGTSLSAHFPPEHGTLGIVSNTVTYTPDPGFTGVDVFTVKETDATLEEARLHKIRVVVGAPDTVAPAAPEGLSVYGASPEEVFLSWPHTTDNVEVYGYNVYRDAALIGKTYTTTTFTDTPVALGVTHDYTVAAFDDAGNLSAASETVSGGPAPLWGQDDFEDGDYMYADPSLTNGLTWTVDRGGAVVEPVSDLLPELNGLWVRVGVNIADSSRLLTPDSLPAPFRIDFHDSQQYAVSNLGLLFLYQDASNYYRLEISRDVFALHRTVDGVTTAIGTAPELKMQHQLCSARFSVQVIVVGDAVVVECTKREWTRYDVVPPAMSTVSQSVTWVDDAPAAAVTVTSGRIGFYQDTPSSWNVARYDNILIGSLAGDGPDRDANGMADAWEIAYYGELSTPEGVPSNDSDGDGMSTLEEYVAGTDPTDPASRFEIVTAEMLPVSGLQLKWPSVTNRTYDVFYSTNLSASAWYPMPGYTNLSATPPTNQVVIPTMDGQSLRFRVRR